MILPQNLNVQISHTTKKHGVIYMRHLVPHRLRNPLSLFDLEQVYDPVEVFRDLLGQYPTEHTVQEEEGRFVARYDLPGIDKEDVNIEIQGDTLDVLVTKEKKSKHSISQREYHYRLGLDDRIDRENISASLKNGVLEVYLPKGEVPKQEYQKIDIT
jgi:HSP20 family protein